MNLTWTEFYDRKADQIIIQEQLWPEQSDASEKKLQTPSKPRESPRPIWVEDTDAIIKRNQVE